jgi:uncharacterized protein
MTAPVDYHPPWWLPGGHLQTIYPYFALRSRPPRYRRERVETADGDFVDFDWLDGAPDAPLLVLFHGLEGCSRSHYASAVMNAAAARGWRGVVAHFRGCSGEPNRLPRAYHSGDADEIDWMLRVARSRASGKLFAVGVSLGGNALLKWLAREGAAAAAVLDAAAAVSAPMDLMAAGDRLGRGFNRIYGLNFLRSLKRKSLDKLRRFPAIADRRRIAGAWTLRRFDDAFTAPVHGFRNVEDYWTRASSKPELDRIRLATLIVHARNDPFLPGHHLPAANQLPDAIECEFTAGGGHVGFAGGPFPGNLNWLPQRLLGFFARQT